MKSAPLVLILLAFAGCSPALPSLPEGNTPLPTSIRVVGEAPTLVAGQWGVLTVEVLDQTLQPMRGQTVSASVVDEDLSQAPGLSFGVGNSCTTGGDAPQCALRMHWARDSQPGFVME